MRYKITRYGLTNLSEEVRNKLEELISEIAEQLLSIDDDEIVSEQEAFTGRTKSISKPLTNILEGRMIHNEWNKEVRIFQSSNKSYQSNRWSLDFEKDNISLEIAFNHEEGTAWNIIKGYISNKSKKIPKSITTIGSIIITATNDLKRIGGFDSSIGSFEKYQEYMGVLEELLEYPIILIGLEGPDTFLVKHKNVVNKKLAKIERRR